MKNSTKSLLCFLFLNFFNFGFAQAQGFPEIQDHPPANQLLKGDSFEHFADLLLGHKLATQLNCEIRVRRTLSERKFSVGLRNVEALEIEYRPGGFLSSERITLLIPEGIKFGTRRIPNPIAGVAEEFRVELKDSDSHWISLKHDGRYNLIWFEIGNHIRNLPCHFRTK